jgi:hypothetical protein
MHHPDAHEWTPDNPHAPHAASWYKFYVDSVYYFGGSPLQNEIDDRFWKCFIHWIFTYRFISFSRLEERIRRAVIEIFVPK